CVLVADCAPLALASPEGVVAVAHAGWRGLLAGVVEAAVGAMASLGATSVEGALGPCIHPCCYEFGARDLARMAEAFGGAVVGRTQGGRPALDLPAATRSALEAAGGGLVADAGRCTGCTPGYFSHRRRADAARQAMTVWRAPGPAAGRGR
ncbi:MAG TPA: polyphenol oxidase family protein, partial [Acidimicrobiales bacterium]|nr:polyphenol oxidase family protein [Acidimicrobiales bacterium]